MTGPSVDLATYLRARLDEESAAAHVMRTEFPPPWTVREKHKGEWEVIATEGWMVAREDDRGLMRCHAEWIAEWNPARVLAEVAAKRAILDLHQPELGQHPDFCGHDLHQMPCPTLMALAQPYAGRPGFDPAWVS